MGNNTCTFSSESEKLITKETLEQCIAVMTDVKKYVYVKKLVVYDRYDFETIKHYFSKDYSENIDNCNKIIYPYYLGIPIFIYRGFYNKYDFKLIPGNIAVINSDDTYTIIKFYEPNKFNLVYAEWMDK